MSTGCLTGCLVAVVVVLGIGALISLGGFLRHRSVHKALDRNPMPSNISHWNRLENERTVGANAQVSETLKSMGSEGNAAIYGTGQTPVFYTSVFREPNSGVTFDAEFASFATSAAASFSDSLDPKNVITSSRNGEELECGNLLRSADVVCLWGRGGSFGTLVWLTGDTEQALEVAKSAQAATWRVRFQSPEPDPSEYSTSSPYPTTYGPMPESIARRPRLLNQEGLLFTVGAASGLASAGNIGTAAEYGTDGSAEFGVVLVAPRPGVRALPLNTALATASKGFFGSSGTRVLQKKAISTKEGSFAFECAPTTDTAKAFCVWIGPSLYGLVLTLHDGNPKAALSIAKEAALETRGVSLGG